MDKPIGTASGISEPYFPKFYEFRIFDGKWATYSKDGSTYSKHGAVVVANKIRLRESSPIPGLDHNSVSFGS